jgi:aryl-alcohol dehydrogenase-like predicted oxidoreductase
LAIAWTLRRPEVTAAVLSARRPSQIEQTAPAGDWVLSEEDKKELDKILKYHYALLKELKAQVEDSKSVGRV